MWTLECQESFEKLKEALINAPVLAYPDREGQFILDTDASHDCMGSVLSQIQNGEEKVIAYASKKFSQSQRQYCITRKELLAVHHFVHHFKHYLLGRRFIVRTDHRALTWMLNWKNPNTSQYCRWRQDLEVFDMIVKYRPGREHANADALSRLPQCQQCELKHPNPKNKTNVKDVGEKNNEIFCRNMVSFETAMDDQEEDPSLKCVIKLLKKSLKNVNEREPEAIKFENEECKRLWEQRSRLHFRGDLLYLLTEEGKYRLLVPVHKRNELIKSIHETLAYIGTKKMLHFLQEKFYWHNMDLDVRLVIASCKPCGERKTTPIRKHQLNSLSGSYPFEKGVHGYNGPASYRRTRGKIYVGNNR